MRVAQFKIKKKMKNGREYYAIFVPGHMVANGKEGYQYFMTRAEAERRRGELLAETRAQSKTAVLTSSQKVDALRAYERLAEHGLSLSLDKAIALALPHLTACGVNMTVEELLMEFESVKASYWSAASKRNFRYAARSFVAEFGTRVLSEVRGWEIEQWLAANYGSSPGYMANMLRTLRPAFSYAVRRDMLPVSPFSRVERVKVVRDSIDVFTPEEARRLLEVAPPDCVPAYALLLFAGVRPAELVRLTWGDIRDEFVHIRPSVAKTAQVRNIAIEPNLAAFLAAAGVHDDDERIVPPNWKRKNQATRREAGLANRQDAARHSYASYWLAAHKNVDTLKAYMGHSRQSDVLFAHYRAACTPAAAAEYWAIMPPITQDRRNE